VEIYGSQRAVFQTVSRSHIGHPVFQETLQDLTPESPMSYDSTFLIFEVSLLSNARVCNWTTRTKWHKSAIGDWR